MPQLSYIIYYTMLSNNSINIPAAEAPPTNAITTNSSSLNTAAKNNLTTTTAADDNNDFIMQLQSQLASHLELINNLQSKMHQKDGKINTLQSTIQKKDEVIAQLEDKLVKMSMELANIKAAQDEASLKLRQSCHSILDDVERHDNCEEDAGATNSKRENWTEGYKPRSKPKSTKGPSTADIVLNRVQQNRQRKNSVGNSFNDRKPSMSAYQELEEKFSSKRRSSGHNHNTNNRNSHRSTRSHSSCHENIFPVNRLISRRRSSDCCGSIDLEAEVEGRHEASILAEQQQQQNPFTRSINSLRNFGMARRRGSHGNDSRGTDITLLSMDSHENGNIGTGGVEKECRSGFSNKESMQRRKTSKARGDRSLNSSEISWGSDVSSKSSRSFLDSVVFPSTFEDVLDGSLTHLDFKRWIFFRKEGTKEEKNGQWKLLVVLTVWASLGRDNVIIFGLKWIKRENESLRCSRFNLQLWWRQKTGRIYKNIQSQFKLETSSWMSSQN